MNDNIEKDDCSKKESAYEQRVSGRRLLVQLLYEWGFNSQSAEIILSRRAVNAADIDLVYVKDVF